MKEEDTSKGLVKFHNVLYSIVETHKVFKVEAAAGALDKDRQLTFENNVSRYDQAVRNGKSQYADLDLASRRGGYIRHKAINNLEKYLIEFESNFEKNGGKVIWAVDAEEAVRHIVSILKKNQITRVVKSKTLLADEINLNEELTKSGINTTPTNPGEFILSHTDERPRHLSSVIIHKNHREIVDLLSQKHSLNPNLNTAGIHEFIRLHLREQLQSATASIVGANFLVAGTGSICLSENEGDAAINSAIPNIQIVLAGIDKIIPSVVSLDTLLPLFATYYSGDRLNTYNTIISGPRQETESDGPSEMYVVLIDNGRSDVIAHKQQRRALSCIDCGACQNACPVYKTIGGSAYGVTYTGPIGAIITPWMKGIEEYKHLSYASSLCGSCSDVCPVKINLHDQILYNINDAVKMNTYTLSDNIKMKVWHQILKNRKLMDYGKSGFKNMVLRKVYGGKWGSNRILPEISKQSFKQLWEERREGKI